MGRSLIVIGWRIVSVVREDRSGPETAVSTSVEVVVPVETMVPIDTLVHAAPA
jgi:hypothetical protein